MTTKSRAAVVAFIRAQFEGVSEQYVEDVEKRKYDKWHYGACELRDLLDYIYDGPPTKPEERLHNENNQ